MSEDELVPLTFSVESASSFSCELLRVASFSCGFFHCVSLANGYASFTDGTRSVDSAIDMCPGVTAVSGDGFIPCFELVLVIPILVASKLVSLWAESFSTGLCGETSLTASLKDELTIDV